MNLFKYAGLFFILVISGEPVMADDRPLKSETAKSVDRLNETAANMTRAIDKNKIVKNSDAENAAKKIGEMVNSEDFQKKINDNIEKIKPRTVENKFEGKQKDYPSLDFSPVTLFISSSIPKSTLRTYIHDLSILPAGTATVVMRGFIGSMKQVKPTSDFVIGIKSKSENCTSNCEGYGVEVSVDPKAFKEYGILKVPAITYNNGKNRYVIYGDISIAGALEEFLRSEKNDTGLQKYISTMKERGFYGQQ